MAQWETVAEGVSLADLEAVVADMELPKGTKMQVVMDLTLPLGWAFDIAGAELVFRPFVPEGMTLVDVYGEGSQGIVDMEADPAWLVAVLAFIKAHWLAITIAGFLLATIIAFITVMVKLPAVAQIPVWLIIGAAAGIVGLVILGARSPPVRRKV